METKFCIMRTTKLQAMACMFLFCGLLCGQNNNEPITILLSIDNENNTIEVKRECYNKIKRGDFFKIKIDGVNTYLFDVLINNEDKSTSEKLPSNILSLLDFGGLASSLTNLNSVSNIIKTLPEVKEVDSFQDMMIIEINNIMLALNSGVMSATSQTLPEVLTSMNTLYQNKYKVVKKKRTEIDSLLFKIQDYQASVLTIERNLIYIVPNNNEISNSLDKFKALKTDIQKNKTIINEFESLLLAIPKVKVFEKELKDNKDYSLNFEKLKNISENLKKANDELEKLLSIENYTKISSLLMSIANNNSYSYTSLPIQHFEDLNKIEITIKPRDKTAQLSSYKTILRIPDYQKTFWGVSTGFYITDNLEENYSIVERIDNGETVYDLIDEDSSSEELGISTMVRYGRNISGNKYNNIFWQFGFGAGITINEKIKPRLLIGTGFAFGGKNKFFIDFGSIYIYHDKLSNVYKLEGNLTQPESFLVNSTSLEGYISLGYLIKLK